jgi:hypothetical protein
LINNKKYQEIDMKQLSRTPETIIAEMLVLAGELEKTPGMTHGSAGQIISGIKADLSALKQLNMRNRYHHRRRENLMENVRELYVERPIISNPI